MREWEEGARDGPRCVADAQATGDSVLFEKLSEERLRATLFRALPLAQHPSRPGAEPAAEGEAAGAQQAGGGVAAGEAGSDPAAAAAGTLRRTTNIVKRRNKFRDALLRGEAFDYSAARKQKPKPQKRKQVRPWPSALAGSFFCAAGGFS